jgi:hypothetical protein
MYNKEDIIAPTKELLENDRVYFLVNDVNFQKTVAQWLLDIKQEAITEMVEGDPDSCNKGKGKYQAVQYIEDRIEIALSKRESALKKIKKIGEKNNDRS